MIRGNPMVHLAMVTRLAVLPALVVPLLAAGCSTDAPGSSESERRIPALVRVGDSGKQADVPQVLPSLSSDDPLVRWTAQRALLDLTGTTNGYDWSADRASRERAIAAWRAWCLQRGLVGAKEGDGRA